MNTNEPTIVVNEDTPLEEIVRQLDELGLLIKHQAEVQYEYRVYYDDTGNIVATAPTQKDAELYGLSGNYIQVDEVAYNNIFKTGANYRVHNGEVQLRKDNANQTPQLEKSQIGFKTVKNNPGILLEDGEDYNDTEFYDHKNN